MKTVLGLVLTLALLLAGCASSRLLASGPVAQCPETYNGCYAD